MYLFVLAAFALALAILLFGLARRHRTLLDEDVVRELQARLGKLTPQSQGRWGRMSVAQMLHHLVGGIRMATGDLPIPPRKSPLRLFPVKQLIVFVLPFPKGAPTAPALVAADEFDFERERKEVSDLLGSFGKRALAVWPDHPAFGRLDREDWGVMVWKHVNHHLRQFGV
jgi:hypothetical protein